jgi:hypothetical protein
MLGADHVRLRDQADAQQLREHPRIDPVGRHLRGRTPRQDSCSLKR